MKDVIIKTNLLCKSYLTDGEVNNVIKNMNLEIYKEDFTVIMGSSGSGKSTLLYVLSGMDKVTSGDVILSGERITDIKEKDMARIRQDKLGFVFQGINLVPDLTIKENIISPAYKKKYNKEAKETVEKKAEELIGKMGLKDHIKKFPNQLSGGQRQRAAICRALINEPDVVFADEPTGSLNSKAGSDVLDTFTQMHSTGQAVVMVTHDLKAASRGNRIIFLRDGRIDGDLRIDEYTKDKERERENMIYEFLNERNW